MMMMMMTMTYARVLNSEEEYEKKEQKKKINCLLYNLIIVHVHAILMSMNEDEISRSGTAAAADDHNRESGCFCTIKNTDAREKNKN